MFLLDAILGHFDRRVERLENSFSAKQEGHKNFLKF